MRRIALSKLPIPRNLKNIKHVIMEDAMIPLLVFPSMSDIKKTKNKNMSIKKKSMEKDWLGSVK